MTLALELGLPTPNSAMDRHIQRCFLLTIFGSLGGTFNSSIKQAVRVATQYAPPLSSPVGAQVPRAPPSRRNVAVLSHAEYVPTLTAAASRLTR